MTNFASTVRLAVPALSLLFAGLLLGGCSSSKAPVATGFLSDYSQLQKTDANRMRYISPDLSHYNSFMIDPVELRIERDVLKPEQRTDVARYMRDSMIKVLTNQGYQITSVAGTDTARLRIAITDIQKSTWWMNVHPGTKLTGAGTGGASMEAEVIDSTTGRQVAAVVQSGKGSQFELDTFSELDDVKDVIDKWVHNAEERLREMRQGQ